MIHTYVLRTYVRVRSRGHTFERACTWASRILHAVFQPRENPERAEPTVRFMRQPLFDLSLQHNSLRGLDATGKKGSLAGDTAVPQWTATFSFLPITRFRDGAIPSASAMHIGHLVFKRCNLLHYRSETACANRGKRAWNVLKFMYDHADFSRFSI